MATRRIRIKGIANIPQRRKPSNKTEENVNPKPEIVQEPNTQTETPLETPQVAQTEDASAVEPAPEVPKPPQRRAFLKPAINLKRLAQKTKNKPEDKQEENNANAEQQKQLEQSNEVVRLPSTTDQPETIKSTFDQEYPAPPLSPTKTLNRSRIKVAPKLGQRRSSTTIYGSASESEDETRKNFKRIRTESVCSVTSVNNEPTTPQSPVKKEYSSIIQRKCKRTEQSRKMAEARRHFLHKFGTGVPDKQKLTMLDLIFYNPVTNPMSLRQKRELKKSECEEVVLDSTTQADEPQSQTHPETEDSLPAPQIKIGANGEIVIDEKSLIIESAETKKGREELQKSQLVDGDISTSYGIYKREKRSKDWSREETLRFYKALNTLGTDFSLMVELFHGRNRRELKMKFKKEERVNRALIDKALTQPVQFDITELREETKRHEKKIDMIEKTRQAVKEGSEQVKEGLKHLGKQRVLSKKKPRRVQPKLNKQDVYSRIEKGFASVLTSDEEESSDSSTEEVTPILKQTRSGRIPRRRKQFGNSTKLQDKPKVAIQKNVAEFEPGTLMIVSSKTLSGSPMYKVFMVTPDHEKVPIDVADDILSNLTNSLDPTENNVTIPAEEHNITIPAPANSDAKEINVTITEPQQTTNVQELVQ